MFLSINAFHFILFSSVVAPLNRVSGHDRMVVLVQAMLNLHLQLSIPCPNYERALLAHRIQATDRQIDRLVYELYGLTEKEIGLVEAGADEWLPGEHFSKTVK